MHFDTLLAQIGQAMDRTGATRVVIDSFGAAGFDRDPRGVAGRGCAACSPSCAGSASTVLMTVETDHDGDSALSRPGRRGVRRRQRRDPAQRPRGGDAPAHHRGPQDPRRRAPEGRVRRSRSCPARAWSSLPLSVHASSTRSSRRRPHHLGQRRARRDVRRRVLPRLDHPRLRRDRHRQDAAGHRVHRRRRRARASGACCFAFEESRDQLLRNAARLGDRLRQARSATGCCKVVCDLPGGGDASRTTWSRSSG